MQRPTLWTFSNDKSLVVIDRQHIRNSTGDGVQYLRELDTSNAKFILENTKEGPK
jgi:hypothetical protein